MCPLQSGFLVWKKEDMYLIQERIRKKSRDFEFKWKNSNLPSNKL